MWHTIFETIALAFSKTLKNREHRNLTFRVQPRDIGKAKVSRVPQAPLRNVIGVSIPNEKPDTQLARIESSHKSSRAVPESPSCDRPFDIAISPIQARVRSFPRGNRLLTGAARWIISHLAPREARSESRGGEKGQPDISARVSECIGNELSGLRRHFPPRNLDSATRDGCCAERVGGVGKCHDLSISHLPRAWRGKLGGEKGQPDICDEFRNAFARRIAALLLKAELYTVERCETIARNRASESE